MHKERFSKPILRLSESMLNLGNQYQPVSLPQALLCVLCTFWLPVAVTQTSLSSGTQLTYELCNFPFAAGCIRYLQLLILCFFAAVQGLTAFKEMVQDPAGVLDSWDAAMPPCSTSDCSSTHTAQDCNWAGIACQGWQIVVLAMPCTVLSDGSNTGCALMGSPLDTLTQVRLPYCSCMREAFQHSYPIIIFHLD